MNTTKHIFAIHGAYSSPRVFNYLKYKLGKTYIWTFLNYQNKTSDIENIIKSVDLMNIDTPHHIIGHSMGGLIALKLLSKSWAYSISTIATPLGGLELNMMQIWSTRNSFLTDISDTGQFIRSIKSIETSKPVQHLISSTGYSPWFSEPNDGVITIRTQEAFKLGPVHNIDANHLEILLSEDTCKCLNKFLKQ